MPSSRVWPRAIVNLRMMHHMIENSNRSPSKRRYPALYERAVPIALVVIAMAIVVLLVVIVVVVLRAAPGIG